MPLNIVTQKAILILLLVALLVSSIILISLGSAAQAAKDPKNITDNTISNISVAMAVSMIIQYVSIAVLVTYLVSLAYDNNSDALGVKLKSINQGTKTMAIVFTSLACASYLFFFISSSVIETIGAPVKLRDSINFGIGLMVQIFTALAVGSIAFSVYKVK